MDAKQTSLTDNVAMEHRSALKRTCAALAVVFVSMLAINIYSYITIQRMNVTTTSMRTAALNLKLEILEANLGFKEITGGVSKKGMNSVWQILDKAKLRADALNRFAPDAGLRKRLDAFKSAMLSCHDEFQRGTDADKAKKILAEYDKAFDLLMSGVDGVDRSIRAAVESKMSTFKVLFIALLVNLVVLFLFVAHTFFKYSKQRRKVEGELASAKETLGLVINSARSILVATDSELAVKEWNSAAEEYTKISSDEALGKGLLELLPVFSGYKSAIEKVYHSKHAAEFYSERIETEDGDRFYNMSIAYSSGIDGVVLQIDDVTEREVREEQLLQSRKLKMVMTLIGGLARNFNDALGNIVDATASLKKALKDGGDPLEASKDGVDVIESAAEKADVMAKQLLALSEDKPPKRERVELNALLRRVMKICENTLDKRVELNAELYAGAAVVFADPKELEHAFLELCDNAARAITSEKYKEDVRDLTVSLNRTEIDDAFRERQPLAFRDVYWAVRVTDTGLGMDAETVAKMFEPFFSTDPAATGLGLAIVNDIVSFHQGFIDVRSDPENGTIVTIYLPEHAALEPRETEEPPSDGGD